MSKIPHNVQEQIKLRGLSAVLDEVSHREDIARDELVYWKQIRQAMQDTIPRKTESPIEEMFWSNAQDITGLVPQYEIGKYRVDFALPDRHVAIELDGHDYHKTKEQRTNDAQRERELKLLGWDVVRFTGSEVYKDVSGCVAQLTELINAGN